MTLIDFRYKEFTRIVTAIAVAPTQRERSIVVRMARFFYTVEPLNKGHLGTQAVVPYSEVPYSEVRVKTVLLCTNIASVIDNEV